MTREEIHRDIEATLGKVPGFLKAVPDDAIEAEWNLFKQNEFTEGVLPDKVRELIGVGIAAAIKCPYCTAFHGAAAKAQGASEQEISAAIQAAKNTAAWSTFMHGHRIDLGAFERDVEDIIRFMTSSAAGKEKKEERQPRVH